jgi:putative RNA 2'-phosphotransferase
MTHSTGSGQIKDIQLMSNSDMFHKNRRRFLYHGTSEKTASVILQNGLQKMNRHHVHLSADMETAIKVGQRHGKPVVFQVRAHDMFVEKYEFYRSENGVWLTYHVPAVYLTPST